MLHACAISLSLLVSCPFIVSAVPSLTSYALKETVSAPFLWEAVGAPPPEQTIELRIGLQHPGFELIEKHLYEVSDPTHRRYGQHLTKAEVEALVVPPQESLSVVDTWLKSFDVDTDSLARSPGKDWVILVVPVHKAENLLNTKYSVWKHAESGEEIIRTTSYSLPAHLHKHIDVVQPTTMFGQLRSQGSTIFSSTKAYKQVQLELASTSELVKANTVPPICAYVITIQCLELIYNFKNYHPSGRDSSIGVTGYLEEYANIKDLQQFYAEQKPEAYGTTFEFQSVSGGINDQHLEKAGIEANLDTQFAFGLSYPARAVFWSTAGRPPFKPNNITVSNTNEPYAEWLQHVLESDDIPYVITTSYGDIEATVPPSYARRLCSGFAQLGLRGVSVIFSSGDWGVGDGDEDPDTQRCFTNDGKKQTKFQPIFPAFCPFVTSIGGTTGFNPEVATKSFPSGGGFSDYFSRPAYQDRAVGSFLRHLPQRQYHGLFNRNGRGIPDISAQGENFRVWHKGEATLVGGTSASAPAVAAIIALLNDARLRSRKGPLGFINPLLYAHGHLFNDVTVGNNAGCGTPGFNATEGWDPVTGLGTPDFGKMQKVYV